MTNTPSSDHDLLLTVAGAWTRLEQRLDAALSTLKGISFTEYRMLRHLADAPNQAASRVDIAHALQRTPSGITRALQPLEKLGYVETRKSERDARLALAALTGAGQELVDDATGVLNDVGAEIMDRAPTAAEQRDHLAAMITELAGG